MRLVYDRGGSRRRLLSIVALCSIACKVNLITVNEGGLHIARLK